MTTATATRIPPVKPIYGAKPGWFEIDGEPWRYRSDGKGRSRGKWIVCQQCFRRAPAYRGNPGTHCSHRCTSLARKFGCGSAKGSPDLFSAWTPEEAWLAGLIWSDGCLCIENRERGGKHIIIISTDEEIASQAAGIAGVSPVVKPKAPPRKLVYSVRIGQPAAVARLIDIGLGPRKSLVAPWPAITAHEASFLRGYFDGDGHVSIIQSAAIRHPSLVSSFVGSWPFLSVMQQILLDRAGINPKKIGRAGHSPAFQIQYHHQDSMALADFIYSEPGPCLSRKRDLFKSGRRELLTRRLAPGLRPVSHTPTTQED